MSSTSFYLFMFAAFMFCSVRGDDVEQVLAKRNLEGYPSQLLFESVGAEAGARTLDRARVAEMLEAPEVRAAVARSALEYSAKMLNRTGQARYLSDPGLCEYSWVSWLPWMGCDAPEAKQTSGSLPLIMESSYSCY